MEKVFKRKVSSTPAPWKPSSEMASNNISQEVDLMPQDQSAAIHLQNQSYEYGIRLNASIDVCRFLLSNALPFSSRDTTEKSLFLRMIEFLRDHSELFREVTLQNAIGNDELVAPSTQKDICDCFAQEVLKRIFDEIGNNPFALVVYESSHISKEGQMAVVLRYVDSCGIVKERFVGLVYVTNTSSLKSAIDSLFHEYGLSLEMVRGQGYHGATNMCDEFDDLKALIMRENSSAYNVHCFAHQLHLVVVEVAEEHDGVGNFFDMVAMVRSVVCASCNQKDTLRERQKEKVEKAIGSSEIEIDNGLDSDRCWSSHYETLLHFVELFSCVVEVLKYVEEEGRIAFSRRQAVKAQIYFESFDFVFYLHLMLHILGVTDTLSQYLQNKDGCISNVISLIESTKRQLREFKVDGFNLLLKNISSFCEKHEIEMVNMEDNLTNRRQETNITCGYYYEFDCFNTIMDMQIQEFDNRFNEISSELLICMSALDPRNSFRDFNESKLVRLAELYKDDFSYVDKMSLAHQLHLYIDNVQIDGRFANLNGISDLARIMVETGKHLTFPLVYRLLKLALVLPVTTATIEKDFSAMNILKSELRNLHDDEFLNAGCICAIEREALHNVSNEDVMNRFKNMRPRRE